MKAAVLDSLSDLTGLFDMMIYDTKLVHFLFVCCNAIIWVHKTRQVYDPESDIVCGAHLLLLDVKSSENNNMNSFGLSDKFWNVYQFDHWMRK